MNILLTMGIFILGMFLGSDAILCVCMCICVCILVYVCEYACTHMCACVCSGMFCWISGSSPEMSYPDSLQSGEHTPCSIQAVGGFYASCSVKRLSGRGTRPPVGGEVKGMRPRGQDWPEEQTLNLIGLPTPPQAPQGPHMQIRT